MRRIYSTPTNSIAIRLDDGRLLVCDRGRRAFVATQEPRGLQELDIGDHDPLEALAHFLKAPEEVWDEIERIPRTRRLLERNPRSEE